MIFYDLIGIKMSIIQVVFDYIYFSSYFKSNENISWACKTVVGSRHCAYYALMDMSALPIYGYVGS